MSAQIHEQDEDLGHELPLAYDQLSPMARAACDSFVVEILLRHPKFRRLIVALWWLYIHSHAVRGFAPSDMPHTDFGVATPVHDTKHAYLRKRWDRAMNSIEREANKIDGLVNKPPARSIRCASCNQQRSDRDRFCGSCGEHMGEPPRPEGTMQQ